MNTMDIKRENLIRTLQCIQSCEDISLLDLTRRLSLSNTSVLQNVKQLSELGLVTEVGSYESTGGRKARAYAPVRDARLAVGLDLTANHVSVVLINLCGQIEHFQRQRVKFSLDDAYLSGLGEMVESISSGAGDKIIGVGISLPGIVDNEAGILRHSHVLGLHETPLETFKKYISLPCGYINDANSAGFAEAYGKKDLPICAYLYLSTSVGGALLKNGSLYQGHTLRAGEFGHTTLFPDGRDCYCGKKGCLDAYCSTRILADQAAGSLADFFTRIEAGDQDKQKIWHTYLEHLAIAVNNINMALDCDVIIGGYLGVWFEKYGAPFQAMLSSRNTFGKDISFLRPCAYKYEAAAVGAAMMHTDSFIRSISPS